MGVFLFLLELSHLVGFLLFPPLHYLVWLNLLATIWFVGLRSNIYVFWFVSLSCLLCFVMSLLVLDYFNFVSFVFVEKPHKCLTSSNCILGAVLLVVTTNVNTIPTLQMASNSKYMVRLIITKTTFSQYEFSYVKQIIRNWIELKIGHLFFFVNDHACKKIIINKPYRSIQILLQYMFLI